MILHRFCVYFSIRLGSILIGIFSLIQSICLVVMISVWYTSKPTTACRTFKEYFTDIDLLYVTDFVVGNLEEPSPFREILTVFFCLHSTSCFSLIFGSYFMKPLFIVPFLFLEMVRLSLLMFTFVTCMLILKENVQGLALLIELTLLGSSVLIYFFYTWFCTYSLYKVLNHSAKQEDSIDIEESPPKLYPAYSGYESLIAPVY